MNSDKHTKSNGVSLFNCSRSQFLYVTDSNCVFLIGVGVDEQLKGNGFVNTLIAYTLNQAKESGAKFVLGYGRLLRPNPSL